MNRICKSALLSLVLLDLAGGFVSACGGGDDHDHKPGEKHDDHK